MAIPSYIPNTNRILWSFDGCSNPLPDEKILWEPFNDIDCEAIESAYINKKSEIEIKDYTIDFQKMIRYNKSDPNTHYRICRHISNDSMETMCCNNETISGTSPNRRNTDRFMAPPELHAKSFGDWSILQCPIVERWIEQNPHYEFKLKETIEQIASGIEKEGSEWKPDENEGSEREPDAKKSAKKFADKLRNLKNKPLDEVVCYCVKLYTDESFLYKLVNQVLREWGIRPEEDKKKRVSTLGPYCCMLRNFLNEDNETIFNTVYRATYLKPEQFKEYKAAKGQIKTWLGFSSTSLDKEVTKTFGNTLFVIEFKNDAAPCYPGRDISGHSFNQVEKEVLLYPGVDFRIDHVQEIDEDKLKYIIYLSLM